MAAPSRIGFFVHHQGRGHATRCKALIAELGDRPIDVLTADPTLFEGFDDRVRVILLPDHIGEASRAAGLFAEPTPSVMHSAPLGVAGVRTLSHTVARWFAEADPALFLIDVSAELALFARLCSVPAVKIRMHGRRGDPGHLAAYEAAVGLLAPFDERLEQPDYPDWARKKTHYTGGLSASAETVPSREGARRRLGLDPDVEIVLVISGAGALGAPWAPLTMAARALPDTAWYAIGPVLREGHETEFPNLHALGWVNRPIDWMAAADLIIGAPGDNVTHEVARISRPFLAAPEWRYFDEQREKAKRLTALEAAVIVDPWPGTLEDWRTLIARGRALDPGQLAALYSPGAAASGARWLEALIDRLWAGVQDERPAVRAAAG